MRGSLTWRDRYLLSISEDMIVKDIMALRNVGQSTALKIRKQAIDYCLLNDIDLMGIKVPTIAIHEVTKLNIEYYYQKMLLEARAKEVVNYASI